MADHKESMADSAWNMSFCHLVYSVGQLSSGIYTAGSAFELYGFCGTKLYTFFMGGLPRQARHIYVLKIASLAVTWMRSCLPSVHVYHIVLPMKVYYSSQVTI